MQQTLTPATMTILILAILVGLVAAYIIRGALTPQAPSFQQEASTNNPTPLASADLPAGRTIVESDMVLASLTPQQIAERPWGRTLSNVMMGPEQIIGRTLKNTVAQGGPFLLSDFYLQGTGPDLLQMLRPGYRAISLQVPFERGGFVPLGANVDVIFRTAYRAGNEVTPPIPETTIVLVENAEVIALERMRSPSPSSTVPGRPPIRDLDLRTSNTGPVEAPSTIVLAVTPEQANKIEAVRNHGEFTLLSRPERETSFGGPPPPTSLEEVLGLQTMLPEQPPATEVTEIYRRGQRQLNAFQFSAGRFVPANQ